MTGTGESGLKAEIGRNLERVRGEIAAAAARAGKKPEDIALVAVSKGQPVEAVRAAVEMGIRVFGENRVQEAKGKIAEAGEGLEWHMVGRFQTNKARDAAGMFQMVQSVDRVEAAIALNRAAEALQKPLRTLIQVNITGAAQQGGAFPEQIDDLFEKMSKLPYLRICGLMAIGPYPAGEEDIRRAYRAVRGFYDGLASRFAGGPGILSVGMSGDFGMAIEEGSTMVRIGTAIFGDRRKT